MRCMHVHMYVCVYVRVYVCMYVCMHVCLRVCMYVCVCACMYVCLLVCTYACVCTYTCDACLSRVSARTRACMYRYVFAHKMFESEVCVCVHLRCVFACMCVCMYVCMYVCNSKSKTFWGGNAQRRTYKQTDRQA